MAPLALLFMAASRFPTFSDHSVFHVYRGRPAPLKPKFRHMAEKTNVAFYATHRADFAGHWIVALGSCGAGCLILHLIDAKTGDVIGFKPTISAFNEGSPITARVNSRLLVIRGELDEDEKRAFGVHYYVLSHRKLVHIGWVPKPRPK